MMVRLALIVATLALPISVHAGALSGGGSGTGALRCTDSATATFDAAFYGNGTCVVDEMPGTSGFIGSERLCRVAGERGGDLRVSPRLSFTWDRTGPITVIDGQCVRI